MKEKELNTLLLNEFPDIKESFDEETSWQDGLDTGCTVTFADVFTPYIVKTTLSNNEEKTKKIFEFIDKLASLKDEYAKQVILLSIFDPLFVDHNDVNWTKYFGENTIELYQIYKDDPTNKWPYDKPTQEEFLEVVNKVKEYATSLGAELVGFNPQKITTITPYGEYVDESGRDIYKYNDVFVIIDDLYFDKPHIVFTYSDTIDGVYEDGDSFPYDLTDDELLKEVKIALNIE